MLRQLNSSLKRALLSVRLRVFYFQSLGGDSDPLFNDHSTLSETSTLGTQSPANQRRCNLCNSQLPKSASAASAASASATAAASNGVGRNGYKCQGKRAIIFVLSPAAAAARVTKCSCCKKRLRRLGRLDYSFVRRVYFISRGLCAYRIPHRRPLTLTDYRVRLNYSSHRLHRVSRIERISNAFRDKRFIRYGDARFRLFCHHLLPSSTSLNLFFVNYVIACNGR